MDGVLVVDKPAGITSHDAVKRIRRIVGERSVGHLGTLDPMATGVLVLLLGRFTRLAQFYLEAEKTYEGEIRFGFATDSYDAEGDPITPITTPSLNLVAVQDAAREFIGTIEQVPPRFSAKKISGVPAYKLARKGQPVDLKAVRVDVRSFEIRSLAGERARFVAHVASGTYVRALAHELGSKLGVGAHLAALRRTGVAEFTISHAWALDDLAKLAEPLGSQCPITDITLNNKFVQRLLHPRSILPSFPAVTAPEETLPRLLHGNAVNLPEFGKAPLVKVFRGQCELVAIARRVAGTLFQPKVVLADAAAAVHATQY